MATNRQKFTLKKMTLKLDEIIKKHTSSMPTQVGLNLPKLKKNDGTKKIELPKLKKMTKETA